MQNKEHSAVNGEQKIGRHAARVSEEAPKEEAPKTEAEIEQDEYDAMLDEGEIPVRRKKKASAKKNAKKGKAKKKTAEPLFSDRKFRRKKSLFDIMSASGEDSFFKPLHLFGHEIRFWPLFVLILIVMLIGTVIISNGNITLQDQQVTVVGLADDLEGYNILVLSDLNAKRFGDQQTSLIREVESQKYDMILCVGDMVGKSGDAQPFYEFLEGISKPERVYFICGDSDPGPFVETPREIEGTLSQIVLEDWILGAIERGAHYVDVPTLVEVGESRFWLTPTAYLNLEATAYRDTWRDQMKQEEDGVVSGLASDYNSLPFTSYRAQQAEKFYSAVGSITSTDLLIGLSHVVPDDAFIRSAALHDNDEGKYLFEPELIVSGHYCGGVWKIPFVGAFYVPNRMLPRYGWFPAKEDVSGLSQIGETQVYISGGLSTTASVPLLPFRLFNDPEITAMKLTAKLPGSMLDMG